MKLDEYQKLSKRTLPRKGNGMQGRLNISNYSMGLAGEAGEVIDLLKKHVHHLHGLDSNKVSEELGDVLHYVAGLATMCGLSLEDIAKDNIEKLKRRYPNGFNTTDSINRKD